MDEKDKPFHVELTPNQKKVIIEYMLDGVSKGIFEDCPDFWEGMSDEKIDELYPAYREKAEQFVEQLKQQLLDKV